MLRLTAMCGFVAALALTLTAIDAQEKESDKKEKDVVKKGKVIGVLVGIGKEKKAIEVKADGEEKARIYVPHWVGGAPAQGGGPDKKMLKVFAELKVGSRVEVTWEFEERLRAVEVKVLQAPKEQKKDGKEEEVRSGKSIGIVVSKGEKFIELRGDGEERARKYHPRWLTEPKPGFDPEVLKAFHKLTVGSRVQLEWQSSNHGPLVHRVEVLKAAADNK
jgi:hypothetical protein